MRSLCGCFQLMLLAVILQCGESLFAQQFSPNNPFRSYNITGTNYGSQQWERQHSPQQWQPRAQPQMRGVRRYRCR